MRGLKQSFRFTDYRYDQSHLLQMRGLKPVERDGKHNGHKSHLLQMRGLKLPADQFAALQNVASFTDAWIETRNLG